MVRTGSGSDRVNDALHPVAPAPGSGSLPRKIFVRLLSYLLDALIEKDGLPEGQSPLTASDTLANPLTGDSRD